MGALAGLGRGGGLGGRGGERGSSGLLWGDESSGDSSRFESKLLTPTQYADMADSATIGVGVDVPEVAPAGEAAGLVDVEASEGKAAWRRRLSPRHRDAVQEFFSSGQED